jgi:intraflagellar transport protein 56
MYVIILIYMCHYKINVHFFQREYLQTAQTSFNQVGSSESEHDSVFGRLCMASAHFLSRNFDHAALYMNSVRQHYYNDDTFNFNYAQVPT